MYNDFECVECGNEIVSVYTLAELKEVGHRWTLCPKCKGQLQEKGGLMFTLDLVVTRHNGLVEYLKELDLVSEETQVVAHATPDMVRGKHVCGVLPHSLSCLCETFTEVPLRLTPELRGVELSLDQVRELASDTVTYRVRRV